MQEKIVNIINREPFIGEDGLPYIKITKEIFTPRKTFIKGLINGKYRGDKIYDEKANLYDFEIYEAQVFCNSLEDCRKDQPFIFPHDFKNIENVSKIKGRIFPKEKLPEILAVTISSDNQSFGINILEPQLFEFDTIRKQHQTDGNEVFGSFNAYITGYVFDYVRSEEEEIIPDIKIKEPIDPPIVEQPEKTVCKPSNIKTGKTQTKGNYTREEYYCSNHNDTVWGDWNYSNNYSRNYSKNDSFDYGGCLGQTFSIIALLLGAFFLIKLFPFLLFFIAYYLIILLIGLFGSYFKWIFRILGILFFVFFIGSLINSFYNSSHRYIPKPVVVDSPREINPPIPTVEETGETNISPSNDSLITRYRNWKDYSRNQYEGKYQIKLSDYRNAHYFKNNLSINQNTPQDYDKIIFNIKEFDKNKFSSLYHLFDSIGKANKLNKIKFAEMIGSFVQDIPYALILDNACDASIYNDRFTRTYILNNQGDCFGYQKFGINTPVEFLTNLKGDCDTRTLLLYTIFSHYDYDVAVLSSEFYGHSIIGLNIPVNGLAYNYKNQRYVMWETTAPNSKPGLIPNEISNLNNWRISLKSK